MTPPGTFERVYAAIKQRLREGMYRPGGRLEPSVLSLELNASVTPVRDALHRLTGERLVEAPRHEGFRVPVLTETLLRQLYAWHLDLLLLAVMRQRAAAVAEPSLAPDLQSGTPAYERLNAMFRVLAQSGANAEHVAALDTLRDRLEPIQRLEERFLDALETETAEIVRTIRSQDRRALRGALLRYHRRRARIVPELLDGLHQD